MKNLILSVIFGLLTCCCTVAQKTEFSKESLSELLINPENGKETFSSILKKHEGKAVVVEVWASWCSDCLKSMPKAEALQGRHPEVDYIFISMDKDKEKWRTAIEKYHLKGDHYLAPDGIKGKFAQAVDVDWIPRYIILDATGKIITYRAIETDFSTMETTLNKLKS